MTAIHFVVTGSLFPVDNGYRSTGFHLAEELAKLRPTKVFLASGDPVPAEALKSLESIGCEACAVTVPRAPFARLGIPAARVLKELAGGKQAWVEPLRCAGVGANGARVVFFSFGWDWLPAACASAWPGAVFFPADSISLFEATRPRPWWLPPARYCLASWIEGRTLRRGFSAAVYVSKRDAAVAARLGGASPAKVVPIGIDEREYSSPAPITSPLLLFTGVMEYLPNRWAAEFLATQVMPAVRTTDARLVIAGRGGNTLARLASDRVEIRDWVPSLAALQRTAAISFCPTFAGAGAKNKVIQSLACGVPVIGTRSSFAGFHRIPPGGFVCKDSSDFAARADELLSDLERLRLVGAEARDFVLRHHTWRRSAERLVEVARA